MYNPVKAKEIMDKYKMLERDDAAEIIEAFNAIDEEMPSAEAIKKINDDWSTRFKKAFFSGTIEEPGLNAPEEPMPETAPAPSVLENSGTLTYDNLFTEVKDGE